MLAIMKGTMNYISRLSLRYTSTVRSQIISRSSSTLCDSAGHSIPHTVPNRKLTISEKKLLDEFLRVDHAGEIGANYIYDGQIWALGLRNRILGSQETATMDLIRQMRAQEDVHLRAFDTMLQQHQVRPSALRPVWEFAGFTLGAVTALMGKEAAMACTEAVENVIGDHYNDQIRILKLIDKNNDFKELRSVLRTFRDDELEHRDTAVNSQAHNAPLYGALSSVISNGCRVAIWIAARF